MTFQCNQSRHGGNNHAGIHHTVEETAAETVFRAYLIAVRGHVLCKDHDKRQFGNLGGLKRDETEIEPPLGSASEVVADHKHRQKQKNRNCKQNHRKVLPENRRAEADDQEHSARTDERENKMSYDEVGAVVMVLLRIDRRGAVNHYAPEQNQNHGQKQHRNVGTSFYRERRILLSAACYRQRGPDRHPFFFIHKSAYPLPRRNQCRANQASTQNRASTNEKVSTMRFSPHPHCSKW